MDGYCARRRGLELALFLALAFGGRMHGAEAQTLKVLSLNFNSEVVAFDDNHGAIRDLRFKALVDWVRVQQPDVILIAEGWNYDGYPSVAIPLAQAIGYDYAYKLGSGFPTLLWDSNAVLARKELRLERADDVVLPHSAWYIGDRDDWILPFGKITHAVGARITLSDGSPAYVYATHLLGDSGSDRRDQTIALQEHILDIALRDGLAHAADVNAIVGGDLNSDPGSPEVAALINGGYVDTWAEAHPDHFADGIGATDCTDPFSPNFNPMQLGAGQLPGQDTIGSDSRIDYVFARGPAVSTQASTVVFTHPEGGFWMSDHYGVLSTVSLGDLSQIPPPNWLTDSDETGLAPPARVLEVNDDQFAPCDEEVDCAIDLPEQRVDGLRGLTLVNHSSDTVYARIDGPTEALPSRKTTLDPAHASSFILVQPGDYSISIYDREGDLLQAPIRARW